MQFLRLKGLAVVAAAAAVLVCCLVVTPTAGAAITATNVMTPADPSFFIADNDAASQTFAISGTTTGGTTGDFVDINCYRGTSDVSTVAANVAVNADGSFSVPNADMNGVFGQDAVCQLRAVPAGTTPSDLTPFAGPWIGVGERDSDFLSSGPNNGTLNDYYIYAQQRTAANDFISLGGCGLTDGYLFDSTGVLTTYTWDCNDWVSSVDASGTRSDLQIDGANAYAPARLRYAGITDSTGYPALSYTYSVDPSTGNLVINETDPLVKCSDPTFPPTAQSCATLVATGVTDHRTITTDHDGHVVWITDVFTSTDGQSHAVDVLWENDQRFRYNTGDSTQLEYEFPDESSYSTHLLNGVVSPSAGPGTIFVRMHGAADGDQTTGQGAIVYDRTVTSATFVTVNTGYEDVLLHQAVTVPANGSTRLRFAYVQDYLAANVASLAQAATNAFLNPVTVSKAGTGSGTVTSSPSGVDCGSTCSYGYAYGTSVTLTATPATGSTFTGWSGACTGTGTCTVTTNDATAVTATFALIPETLTVAKGGTGSGSVTSAPAGIDCGATCSTDFPYGSSVTLTATPATGSSFTGWSGACTGTGTCTVTTNGATAVTANFDLTPETLTVAKVGTGSGSVTSAPAGIDCGATCSAAFPYGSSVTLTATAGATSSFAGWSGACSGSGACTVPLTAATSVTASFVRDCVVPNVKGKTLKKAKSAIKAAHCSVGKIKKAASKTVQKGHVISQKPKPKTKLPPGGKVALVISNG